MREEVREYQSAATIHNDTLSTLVGNMLKGLSASSQCLDRTGMSGQLESPLV